MRILEERILKDGRILPGDILKVDNFINHNIDVPFLSSLCDELCRRFSEQKITKVLTVEASGIAIGTLCALKLGVPCLFAKKAKTANLSGELYTAIAHSYTHGNDNTLTVGAEYLTKEDAVLIVDDFLANGAALDALLSICAQAGTKVAGAGIIIEKEYQGGGNSIRARGIRVESLAKIASLSAENGITFC